MVRPRERPIKETGHIRILRGSLAPEGAVAKITGKEGLRFRGPARVFDREEAALGALQRDEVRPGDVVVIRYEGPRGGPGASPGAAGRQSFLPPAPPRERGYPALAA